MITRRNMMLSGALAGGAMLLKNLPAHAGEAMAQANPATEPAQANGEYLPIVTPNNSKLPWKMIDGAKVFHLVAEEVDHEFMPGLRARCWGFNGSVHGPAIEAVQGDRVRIFVTNKLPEPTAVHWHGIRLPNGMDGVSGLNQEPIQPGQTFMYEFPLLDAGTHMYHSHHDEMTQIGLGMTGLFLIHPRENKFPVDRDFALLLHEWRIDAGTDRPNPLEMTDFNVLTINGKCFPGTDPLVIKLGQRVRIRIGNMGPMDHHPIHLHGYHFKITETDGGRLPESAQWPVVTAFVPVGETRTIEFTADAPGDWAMHCHMTHHAMNQMGHGAPNMIGVDAKVIQQQLNQIGVNAMVMGDTGMGEMGQMQMAVPRNSVPMASADAGHGFVAMGGMFTVLKVRENLGSYDDPGWYKNPPGTLASKASDEVLKRNGIE